MATIKTTDEICATLTHKGNIIANIILSGHNTISSIIKYLKSNIKSQLTGIIILKLRNRTQGWVHTKQILLNDNFIITPTEATQLTLF